MDSSVSGKDEIWFLPVCHHVPHELYSFVRRRNRLTTHFSERIPVVKRLHRSIGGGIGIAVRSSVQFQQLKVPVNLLRGSVTGWLVPDLSRQPSGLTFKDRSVQWRHSTLEDDIIMLSQKMRTDRPMMQHHILEGSNGNCTAAKD